MAQPKRRATKQGIGAARGSSSGVVSRDGEGDERPLSMRDTLPAPPLRTSEAPSPVMDPESGTGTRRRLTLGIEGLAPERQGTKEGMSAVAIETTPSSSKSGERRKREALRVDEVRAQKVTLRGAAESRPRVVDRKRVARAPLESRDAFVIQMIDGTMTMSELADASGIAEADLDQIVARLIRLGIVAM